jgi:hypothetical protein
MPKIIISAQAVIDTIEKQEIYLTGPTAWRYWAQSAALHRGRAGNHHTGKIFVTLALPASSIKRTRAVSNAV